MDVLPWLQQQETALIKAFDANDWIYQTWAYERHDVGTTPGMNGDTVKALRRDQGEDADPDRHQGPAESGMGAAGRGAHIRDVRVVTIRPGTVTGHASAGGVFPADVEFLNREIGKFLDEANGQKGG